MWLMSERQSMAHQRRHRQAKSSLLLLTLFSVSRKDERHLVRTSSQIKKRGRGGFEAGSQSIALRIVSLHSEPVSFERTLLAELVAEEPGILSEIVKILNLFKGDNFVESLYASRDLVGATLTTTVHRIHTALIMLLFSNLSLFLC